MRYDQWEAVRLVKCVAALKLMRRYPPLFVQSLLCGKYYTRRNNASCHVN